MRKSQPTIERRRYRARVYDIPLAPPLYRRATDPPETLPAGVVKKWCVFRKSQDWTTGELVVTLTLAITGYNFLLLPPLAYLISYLTTGRGVWVDIFAASQAYRAYRALPSFLGTTWFWGGLYAGSTTYSVYDILWGHRDRLVSQGLVAACTTFACVSSMASRSPTAGWLIYALFVGVMWLSYSRTYHQTRRG